MTQRERMEAGLIYDPIDEDILKEQISYKQAIYEFNNLTPAEDYKKEALMKEMFGSVGEGCYIETPFRANWGGKHVFLGDYVYANFNLTLVDDANIYIGDHVMIGPNVTIATANHPIDPELRARGLQYNREVHIGKNAWIGANTLIVPGVTIGENTVIGGGSVVTKDIPAGVVAMGSPCKVLREIGEHDKEYYFREEKIDWENL